jgi:hypothetical protein
VNRNAHPRRSKKGSSQAQAATTATERQLISKSKYLWGSQCRKLLWHAYNAKDQIPEPDAATQAIFDHGHEVVALAMSLYPGGIEVSADAANFDQVLQESLEAVKARRPLFEAGFVYGGRVSPRRYSEPGWQRRAGHHRGQVQHRGQGRESARPCFSGVCVQRSGLEHPPLLPNAR